MIRMAVLYHSKSGNTRQMAQAIADGMETVEGVEAKIFSIHRFDPDFVAESCCVVLGTPTYLASMSGEMKAFLDGNARKAGLAGKLGGAFATADYLHGGADLAIQGILSHLMVLGMLVYSGGGACGKPVIHLGPVALKDGLEEAAPVFRLYGQRMAAKAAELFGK